MTSPTGLNQFPNATPDGDVLPFSVGDPFGLVTQTIGIIASDLITLPEIAIQKYIAVFLASGTRCIISFRDTDPTPDPGVFSEDQMLIARGCAHAILLPDNKIKCISADGSSTGVLSIQLYRPWKNVGVSSLQQRN